MANEIQQDNDYQKPISIREAMIHIQNAEYVLPGIQRKFTWDIPRIEALFDTLCKAIQSILSCFGKLQTLI